MRLRKTVQDHLSHKRRKESSKHSVLALARLTVVCVITPICSQGLSKRQESGYNLPWLHDRDLVKLAKNTKHATITGGSVKLEFSNQVDQGLLCPALTGSGPCEGDFSTESYDKASNFSKVSQHLQ